MTRALPVGTTINGYRIERVLSHDGSFAVVYQAYDTDAGRVQRLAERIAGRLERWGARYGPQAATTRISAGPYVALKEYIPKQYGVRRGHLVAAETGSADVFAWGRERFLRESEFLSTHSHPNVVAVFDIFSANNTEYYVMEQLAGGSLRDVIRQGGPQSERQIRGWLFPVLEGLSSVERRDANHLDLSPDNIMFRTQGGDPVLVDFGASRISGAAPVHTSRLVVNDPFAAWEKHVLTSSKLTARSDVYSIGAIVNFALSGENPAAAGARRDGRPALSADAEARRAGASTAAFRRIIDKALALEAQDRFSDARVLAHELAATTVQTESEAGPAGGAPALAHRRKVLIGGLIVIALIVVIAAAVALLLPGAGT